MRLLSVKPRKLNERGIAHFMAALAVLMIVGVAGTFALVSSHADASSATAAKTGDTSSSLGSKPKYGVMVLYSENGRFDTARISLSGADPKTHVCGGAFTAAKMNVERKLPAAKANGTKAAPLLVKCSAVGGTGTYNVTFGKNGKYTTVRPVAVNIDQNICTLVHSDPTKIRAVALDVTTAGIKCPGYLDELDTPTKVGVTMKVLPKASQQNIIGFVSVQSAAEALTRSQCIGQVRVEITETASAKIVGTKNYPLKYYKPAGNGGSYCVSQLLKVPATLAKGNYVVRAYLTGSPYLNDADATAQINL